MLVAPLSLYHSANAHRTLIYQSVPSIWQLMHFVRLTNLYQMEPQTTTLTIVMDMMCFGALEVKENETF